MPGRAFHNRLTPSYRFALAAIRPFGPPFPRWGEGTTKRSDLISFSQAEGARQGGCGGGATQKGVCLLAWLARLDFPFLRLCRCGILW
ncbi:hypothetical protein RGR602_CH00952 [Rhizobium gallicum bv. gallicum R602sp]|uniref:Uncharacterized protein n=1 Tax=Rhizobium gallicum bv. gallicum R602sp TaxID=1041138 RepID=A0A0B4X168_9HYPH|nr:hypothetical protein RGR602_CH00952 [Rhizobium gallicum bv. gallicum R602sp]